MNVLHFTRHYYLHHDFYLLLDTFVSRAHTLMCGTNEKWQNRMTTIHIHTQMYNSLSTVLLLSSGQFTLVCAEYW